MTAHGLELLRRLDDAANGRGFSSTAIALLLCERRAGDELVMEGLADRTRDGRVTITTLGAMRLRAFPEVSS